MNVPKILINKPILHILMGTIIGIVTYLFWNQNQLSAVVITALFVLYIYFFYELKYFKILLCFFILGYISIFAYFNLVGNKYGFYEARVEEVYSKYSLGTLNGRKVYINSKENNFEKNEVIKFKGKFKRSIDLDKAIVGDLFVYEIIDVKYDWIYKLRFIPKAYNEYLNKYIRKEHSAVITALTFGNKEFLEKEEKEKFKTLGVIHLICISGFHIAIIHQIIKKILNNNIALVVAFSYVILTGMTASAIRAFLMISCLSLSTTVFKKYDNISALGVSALILLIIKPTNIVDIGFHLSYLATAGILLLYKFFSRGFYRLPKILRESISLSISAQFFVFPYMIVVFGSFSLNFLLGSLVLTPIISIMLPLGIFLFFTFMVSLNISFLLVLINSILGIYSILVEFLNYLAMPMLYLNLVAFVGYSLMIICFYMHYMNVSKFKFKELGYFIFLGIIIGNFNFGTTISVFKSNWNKGIIIKKGFYREAFTASDNEYFIEEIKKNYSVGDVKEIEKEEIIKIDEEMHLVLNKKIENSFIMLKKNKYDIIDLLKKEKRLYHKGKFIYIDERGT